MAHDTKMDSPDADLPFRQVSERLPSPCWISDADGNIVWVNDAWLTYTGKSPEALAAEGLKALHDPAVFPAVVARWREVRASGQPGEMVFPLRARDGSMRPFLTRVVPLKDAQGRVTRWFGTNSDISSLADAQTRAQRSEENLRENEARLRIATETAGVGIWEWRLDSGEMIYSPRARQIYGFGPDEEITYEKVAAATHPEDYPYTSAQADRALDPSVRDREPYEYRVVWPSGEIRWVCAHGEVIFEPLPGGGQKAARYIGTLSDITDRKKAEDLVRESEARLRMALRAGRMAAWRIDAGGALTATPELNAMVGLPPDAELSLQALAPYYMPGELDRIQAAAEQARRSGQRHFEIEYRYRRADGEVRWLHARAEAQVGPDGQPDGVAGIVMDITERKADEERLNLLAREVDHRANNLLTVVESVVALSRADDVKAMREVISGRVQALARAHRLLAEARWTGAGLRRLLEEELAPFGGAGAASPFTLSGPAVALDPMTAQALGMVLHELATNAAKHGALGAPAGRVEITWSLEPQGRLALLWRERGGPPVERPARAGFGKVLIERAFDALSGQAKLDWRPEGLCCEVRLSLGQDTKAGP